MNVADAQPEHAPRVAVALHRFIALVNRILHEGGALDDDARVHAGDLFRVIVWYVLPLVMTLLCSLHLCASCRLSRYYPNGQEDVLAETTRMLERETQNGLTYVFRKEVLIT